MWRTLLQAAAMKVMFDGLNESHNDPILKATTSKLSRYRPRSNWGSMATAWTAPQLPVCQFKQDWTGPQDPPEAPSRPAEGQAQHEEHVWIKASTTSVARVLQRPPLQARATAARLADRGPGINSSVPPSLGPPRGEAARKGAFPPFPVVFYHSVK